MGTENEAALSLSNLLLRRPTHSSSPRRSRRFLANAVARLGREREQFQSDFDRAVAAEVAGLDGRMADAARAIDALRTTVAGLEQQIADGSTAETLVEQLSLSVSYTLAEHLEWMTGLKHRMELLEQRFDDTAELSDVKDAQLVANQNMLELAEQFDHLRGQLASQIGRLQEQLADVAGGLEAVPYMSDPGAFSIVAPSGELILGFDATEAREEASDYAEFEDIFRGSEELIRDRQRVYVPLLEGHSPVLDLGCGRGELLELSAQAGITARGVDSDAGMVERAMKKGLDVVESDALVYLRGLPDNAVGAVFAAQFIEHLDYDRLLSLLRESLRVLEPGGLCILETVNPYSVSAFRTFWTDLTHVHPIFPEVLLALLRSVGFARAYVVFPNGSGGLARDRWHEGEYAVISAKEL